MNEHTAFSAFAFCLYYNTPLSIVTLTLLIDMPLNKAKVVEM